jgi:heterodisulfide reductase subunit B
LTKRTVCPATPRKPLLHAAYRGNIDFKNIGEILVNLLNVKNIYSVIKFILANKVDMPPGVQRKNTGIP